MNDKKILAALVADRANYDKVFEHLDDKDFGPEAKLILSEINEYYEVDKAANSVDTEILKARLERRLPNPKHAKTCFGIVDSLPDVSGANVVREVLDIKAQSLGLELASGIAQGKPKVELCQLGEKWLAAFGKSELEETNEEIENLSIADIVSRRLNDDQLIQIAPKSLNDRLDGGVRPGHHVLVFAPTEMGKTLFVINMVAHFLRQGLRTLYVGNEDPAEDIILRLASRISGRDKFQIKDSPQETQESLDKNGYSNFVFADLSPGTFPRIERLVKKHSPRVLILDQLSNINVNTSKSESKTGSLEEAAKQARRLAKYCGILVISVTQAADSATGRVVLGRGDVHNSNVGIPGQVDLMLGIGADDSMESRGLREITLVKNKISGNHDHFTVKFNTILSRVEG
jgi:archaellum biogenesis ATPase FlaH